MADNYKLTAWGAYLVAKDFEKVAKTIEKSDDIMLAPMVVNATLACELYIKSLLYMVNQSSTKIEIHKFKDLLLRIPANIRKDIEDECRISIFQYDLFLDNTSNAFVDWRYIHEFKNIVKNISILDLLRFADIFRRYLDDHYQLNGGERITDEQR